MDSSSFLELIQILDGVALPREDAEPGGVNDMTSILCGVAVVCCDREIGNFGEREAPSKIEGLDGRLFAKY